MSMLSLVTNPLIRKILPVLGEVVTELGPEVGETDIDQLISLVRTLLPAVVILRKTSVCNASANDVSAILGAAGVKLAPSDIDLWLNEIQAHASDPGETLQRFVTGPDGRAMIMKILQRGNGAAASSVELKDVPPYDPETGLFLFT